MSAIDTYKRYNLHLAAPYIRGKMFGYAKKQGGTSGRRKRPGSGGMLYTCQAKEFISCRKRGWRRCLAFWQIQTQTAVLGIAKPTCTHLTLQVD